MMTDARLQSTIGYLLRIGVYTSLGTVAMGGIFYLIHHGGERAMYPVYQPQHQPMGAVLRGKSKFQIPKSKQYLFLQTIQHFQKIVNSPKDDTFGIWNLHNGI